jgi:hypothetical protein
MGENSIMGQHENRGEPRRSARMTHLCSNRVTHAKNAICPGAREDAGDIIHAQGVRVAVPSSAPEARKALSLLEGVTVPMKSEQPNHCWRGRLAQGLPKGQKRRS